jgi:predicted O-methyltransferase YrrM
MIARALLVGSALVALAATVALALAVFPVAIGGYAWAILMALAALAFTARRSVRALDGLADAVGKLSAAATDGAASSTATLDALSALAERLDALDGAVAAIDPGPGWSPERWKQVGVRIGPGKAAIDEAGRRLVAKDTSALLALHSLVGVRAEPVSTTGYVAAPETLLGLVATIDEVEDGGVIVEAGSGLSTMWLALAIEKSGKKISVIALEHEPEYAEATRRAIGRQGIATRVEVRDAPLEPVTVDGVEYLWYQRESWADLARIDVVFVDGPPNSTGPSARYPAYPLLADALVDGAIVVLDDTDRKAERAAVKEWTQRSGRGTLSLERELDRATLLRYRLTS